MTNKEFASKLEKRTVKFAIATINLSTSLQNKPEALVLRNQLTKSGTSTSLRKEAKELAAIFTSITNKL